jgi:molecular chaperone DnaK
MAEQSRNIIFGIDLGTTYSCIAYVDDFDQPVVVPNLEGQATTPSVVLFDDDTRTVGKEAKNSAVLHPDQVVEMVKRQMGDSVWRYEYQGQDYSPEEISSYILRKVVGDAAQYLGRDDAHPITDVVITCPAYFGINQREATARAGALAGLNVLEIINEPTAAAIVYGLHNQGDQVVLVYDLGGGTFDVTMIEIKAGAISVIATGGDHLLGGRDWDAAIVNYLSEEWKNETGSYEDPTVTAETLQDLWQKAEEAKMSLTSRPKVQVPVMHASQRAGITLTREKFDELTAPLLERTIEYTRSMLDTAREKGYTRFDQLLLVGGSTKMPQVKARLMQEFGMEPKMFDPDQAVAKGAALYGQTVMIGQQIQIKIAEKTGAAPEQVNLDEIDTRMIEQAQQEVAAESGLRLAAVKRAAQTSITNVASHSFGLVTTDMRTNREVISNLVLMQEAIPCSVQRTFHTMEANQTSAEVRIMENNSTEPTDPDIASAKEIGNAEMDLPPNLPDGAPVEFTFELNRDGRLHVIGREPRSGKTIELDIQTTEGMSQEEFQEAKARSKRLVIS